MEFYNEMGIVYFNPLPEPPKVLGYLDCKVINCLIVIWGAQFALMVKFLPSPPGFLTYILI